MAKNAPLRFSRYCKFNKGDMTDKIYHIYAKNECLYNNLSESQFNKTWNTLKGMVGLMQTDYQLEDLTYEECNPSSMDIQEQSY